MKIKSWKNSGFNFVEVSMFTQAGQNVALLRVRDLRNVNWRWWMRNIGGRLVAEEVTSNLLDNSEDGQRGFVMWVYSEKGCGIL